MIEIGKPCPRNDRATVSFEIVMTEKERDVLLEEVVSGKAPLTDRSETIKALLGVDPEER